VLVSGAVAEKSSRLVSSTEPLVVIEPRRFVSRGGEKLLAALRGFGIDVSGRDCLDAGASTGGFTDCLLQSGARRVWAVDVGHGQLAPVLRASPDVAVFERTNIRTATLAGLGAEPFGFLAADLAFISLTTVAGNLANALSAPGADLVVLVKPQFEAGRAEVDRGRGVVRDPGVWRETIVKVGTSFELQGAAIMGVMVSPLEGPAGNVEFLLHAKAAARPRHDDEPSCAALADTALSEFQLLARPGAGDVRAEDGREEDLSAEPRASSGGR
jgi:23S rRNA (cytidine1920-2'-O)/16S rRNA (cytidine1409-2'-O)-methyltransferase